MSVRLLHADTYLVELRTRMPFKYGIATMTHSPHAFVRLQAEIDGVPSSGIAADHLPPKWFTKDPNRAVEEEVDEMLGVIDHAVAAAPGLQAETPFDAWRQLYDIQDRWGRETGLPPLLTHFGTSLIERGLIEASCRVREQPFATLLRGDALGLRLGDIHPELAGRSPRDFLPSRPLEQITARHTIGLADPLTDADIPSDEKLDDGLPQSLEACLRSYGLRHVKLKVHGDRERDRERVRRIADVLRRSAPPDFAFSLDGNEQFRSIDSFRTWWAEMTSAPALRDLFDHLLFVEQPFHRDIALDSEAVGGLRDWNDRPALIIDESDGERDSLRRALQLGYVGTSHKNCKGVFKGVANACLLAHLREQSPEQPVILSGEDLANIGPIALLQDLAVCAALGISSVERNGHHYFAGLSMFPVAIQQQILEAHGDLYHASDRAWPTLTIRDGQLRLGSVIGAPFGVAPWIDVVQFTPRKDWR